MSLVFTEKRRSKSIHKIDTTRVIGSNGESRVICPEAAGNRQRYIGFETNLTQLTVQILDIANPGSQSMNPIVTSLSSRLASVQEQTLRKSISRLEEWRNTIVASERERYRKTFIDM